MKKLDTLSSIYFIIALFIFSGCTKYGSFTKFDAGNEFLASLNSDVSENIDVTIFFKNLNQLPAQSKININILDSDSRASLLSAKVDPTSTIIDGSSGVIMPVRLDSLVDVSAFITDERDPLNIVRTHSAEALRSRILATSNTINLVFNELVGGALQEDINSKISQIQNNPSYPAINSFSVSGLTNSSTGTYELTFSVDATHPDNLPILCSFTSNLVRGVSIAEDARSCRAIYSFNEAADSTLTVTVSDGTRSTMATTSISLVRVNSVINSIPVVKLYDQAQSRYFDSLNLSAPMGSSLSFKLQISDEGTILTDGRSASGFNVKVFNSYGNRTEPMVVDSYGYGTLQLKNAISTVIYTIFYEDQYGLYDSVDLVVNQGQ